MNPHLKVLLLTLSLTLAASPAAAQRKKACPTPPPSPFKHSGEIVTSYDPAARGMRTTLSHPRPVGGDAARPVYMTASFVFARRGSMPVAEIALVAPAGALSGGTLAFSADGQNFDLSGGENNARFQTVKAGGTSFGAARVALPYGSLMNLLRAKKVSARLAGAEYELTHNHLEALRELASQMAPPPSAWDAAQQAATR